ncbi:thioredoxin family protein [Saccharicrinis fermentans]|uniref:Thioredoxin n=1 Tax=Saccharicrinis fermentans DSM 9555 = JCM 21142 TaxID=869213 RepID=W7Y0Q5_9BACT|nr:thioredoxin family protein [Saccharicrinis fermentans]GAF01532.1 thioredoxin [Saccharicrinis fermentans DSM 9555 = JCM 21142]
MKNISNVQDFERLKDTHNILLAYFSHDKCSVCKVLLPKVKELIQSDFPRVLLTYCNIEHAPFLAAQLSIFTVPALVIYVKGKEYVRYTRNIGLNQLAQSIARPYGILMEVDNDLLL